MVRFLILLLLLAQILGNVGAWQLQSVLPQFSPFAPLTDDSDRAYSLCDVQSNVPCNSDFFESMCDVSVCAQLSKVGGKRKRSVCTCYNKGVESHLRFLSFLVVNSDICRQYYMGRVHDYGNCIIECNKLHRDHPLEEYFDLEFRTAPRGSFGCIVDPRSNASSRMFGSDYVKSRGRHTLCFCYRASLGIFRMIRIIK